MASTSKKPRNFLNHTPGGKTRVVRIEVNLLNGCEFEHTLPTSDIINIWKKALKLEHIGIARQANFRGFNSFRINYRLKEPVYLSDLIDNPEFTYEKPLNTGHSDTYTGRVLDVEDIEEAKLGETVTIIVKRTNAELSETQIEAWLMRFGKIISPPRYPRYFDLNQLKLALTCQLALGLTYLELTSQHCQ